MATVENHLIELLPRKDRLQLLASCELFQLALGDVLGEPGKPTRHVYFPIDGFISLLALVDGTPTLEVGLVGREGMLGAQLALGVATTPLTALVQGEGRAWRIGAAAFRREMERSTALSRTLNRYVYVLMRQLTTAAPCMRFHQIGQRLSRWLLMSQDRAHIDTFPITHEFLAHMLGVRRAGVTSAAGVLQRAGLIQYSRGQMTVLNRRGLEAAACGCYAADQQAYASLL